MDFSSSLKKSGRQLVSSAQFVSKLVATKSKADAYFNT